MDDILSVNQLANDIKVSRDFIQMLYCLLIPAGCLERMELRTMLDTDLHKAMLLTIIETVEYLGYRFGYGRWIKLEDIINELLTELNYLKHDGEIH